MLRRQKNIRRIGPSMISAMIISALLAEIILSENPSMRRAGQPCSPSRVKRTAVAQRVFTTEPHQN